MSSAFVKPIDQIAVPTTTQPNNDFKQVNRQHASCSEGSMQHAPETLQFGHKVTKSAPDRASRQVCSPDESPEQNKEHDHNERFCCKTLRLHNGVAYLPLRTSARD
jgi:hypothetical protein